MDTVAEAKAEGELLHHSKLYFQQRLALVQTGPVHIYTTVTDNTRVASIYNPDK